jgi:hypothetical protein
VICKIGVTTYTPESILPEKDFDMEAQVVVLAIVRRNDIASRNVIRQTLGQINDLPDFHMRFQILFVIGLDLKKYDKQTELVEESFKYKDLIITSTSVTLLFLVNHVYVSFFNILDVEDTYTYVVLKQLSAIKWVIDSYKGYNGQPKLKWLIKLDDDIIMNPWAMRNYFQNLEKNPENKICFHCMRLIQRQPYRKTDDKWYI